MPRKKKTEEAEAVLQEKEQALAAEEPKESEIPAEEPVVFDEAALKAEAAPAEEPKAEPSAANKKADPSVVMPMRQKRLRKPGDGNRNVFLADATKRNEQRESKKKENTSELINLKMIENAKFTKKILNATVVSIETTLGITSLVLKYLDRKIIIPFNYVYPEGFGMDKNYTGAESDMTRRREQMLTKFLFSNVPFVITDVMNDGGDVAIIGSRKAALKRIALFNYKKSDPKVKEGDIVTADVVTVSRNGLFLNVKGLDTIVQTWAATNRYTEDLSAVFAPGDQIPVLVKHITYKDDDTPVGVEVSAKEAEYEAFKAAEDMVNIGDICLAKITRLGKSRKTGEPVFELFIDGYDLPAKSKVVHNNTMNRELNPGDGVVFKVAVKTGKGFVIGSIIKPYNTKLNSRAR